MKKMVMRKRKTGLLSQNVFLPPQRNQVGSGSCQQKKGHYSCQTVEAPSRYTGIYLDLRGEGLTLCNNSQKGKLNNEATASGLRLLRGRGPTGAEEERKSNEIERSERGKRTRRTRKYFPLCCEILGFSTAALFSERRTVYIQTV